MSEPTPFEAALARIGTPEDRAACFVRSWGLDAPQYRIAFNGLGDSLKGQFAAAEERALKMAEQAVAEICVNPRCTLAHRRAVDEAISRIHALAKKKPHGS